jgi:CheY-like chemotaxis protein
MDTPHDHAILLVDDDDDAREIYRLILEREGWPVVAAGDGEAALKLLRGNSDDARLIVLDLTMPGLDGAGFHARKQRTPGIADIPVILVSGAIPPQALLGSADIKGILRKPISFPMLLALAHRCLDH